MREAAATPQRGSQRLNGQRLRKPEPVRRARLLWALACVLLSGCPRAERAPMYAGASDEQVVDAAASQTRADAGPATTKLRVLFVGNSYTSTNDLPGWVRRLAASSHHAPSIDVDSIAPGGVSFADHCTSTGAMARIQAGGFTHVVLQAQSVEAVGDPTSFESAGEQLVAAVKKSGATAVLYETWARRAGDAVYAEAWSKGDPAAMQAGIRSAYETLAQTSGALDARVGDAWENVLASHPTLSLLQADGSHPTELGTYLAACVFYAVLTGQSPVGIADHPASASATDAKVLAESALALAGTP